MYEAPDRYKRLIAARLPGGESAGLTTRQADTESSPLRDVQLISRAQLAPFFAAANIVAALMMAANLWASVDPALLGPWALAVGVVNLVAMQLARHQSITCVGRSGHRVPNWMMVGEVTIRAITWLSLPLYLFPTFDPGTQVISASIMAGLAIGGLGLGWLWQVDGENRVSYISSRMSSMLGKPARQLLGPSLPAILGGHAELGR